jgi:hypothetical protein
MAGVTGGKAAVPPVVRSRRSEGQIEDQVAWRIGPRASGEGK